jgi:hypothetical protein
VTQGERKVERTHTHTHCEIDDDLYNKYIGSVAEVPVTQSPPKKGPMKIITNSTSQKKKKRKEKKESCQKKTKIKKKVFFF